MSLSNLPMEAKDWIQLFALTATIISAHWLVSKQTKKGKVAKWIEEFRSEVANFVSLCNRYDRKHESLHSLSKSGYTITLMLDENKSSQEELLKLVQKMGLLITANEHEYSMLDYANSMEKLTNLTKQIIREQERKI